MVEHHRACNSIYLSGSPSWWSPIMSVRCSNKCYRKINWRGGKRQQAVTGLRKKKLLAPVPQAPTERWMMFDEAPNISADLLNICFVSRQLPEVSVYLTYQSTLHVTLQSNWLNHQLTSNMKSVWCRYMYVSLKDRLVWTQISSIGHRFIY